MGRGGFRVSCPRSSESSLTSNATCSMRDQVERRGADRETIGRYVASLIALDQAATADGHRPLPEAVWTAKHKSGDIVTVFRDDAQLVDIAAAGGVSFTLEELVELIPADVLVAKKEFHGIKVVDVRDKTKDEDLNDEIPF